MQNQNIMLIKVMTRMMVDRRTMVIMAPFVFRLLLAAVPTTSDH